MSIFKVKRTINKGGAQNSQLASFIYQKFQQKPFLFFGLPFVSAIVGASYFLSNFTQNRYDYHATRVKVVSKNEKLALDEKRKVVSLQEEYWKLLEHQEKLNNWEPVRLDKPDE